MTEITLSTKLSDTVYLTPAGKVAVETPLAMKEYIYNESRAEAGRDYLLGSSVQQDDTNVTVQCATLADSEASAIAAINDFVSSFNGGAKQIGGHNFLYRSVSGMQAYKEGIVVFSLNLIKLAKSVTV